MLIFGVTFATILLGATWFSAVTWSRFSGVTSLYWILLPMLVSGCFVPLMFLSFFKRNGVFNTLSVISSVALGFLNYALFAALACWIVFGIAKLFGLTLDMRLTAQVCFGLALIVCVGGIVNASYLRTVRATVYIPNLPEQWQGKEVALVSDIHVGSIRGRAFVARIVTRLNKLQPYAVFIPGDMFDGPESDPDRVMQPWTQLQAPAGVYVVSGNHDEFHNRDVLLAAMNRVGLRVLHNEKVCVEGLQILGVLDGDTRNRQRYADILRGMNLSPSMPSILLAHQPDKLDIPERAGVSLQLSGHTHGGQFWPWNLIVSRMYGPFAYGLGRKSNMQVFTSNGAGTWGPPMRVGTRSEIVILTLARGVTP
ncbi:MAG: metallophosphoesterase [Opitutales bacterium]